MVEGKIHLFVESRLADGYSPFLTPVDMGLERRAKLLLDIGRILFELRRLAYGYLSQKDILASNIAVDGSTQS